MTDQYSHPYSTDFHGLLTSAEVSLAVVGVCILGWEIARRLPRDLDKPRIEAKLVKENMEAQAQAQAGNLPGTIGSGRANNSVIWSVGGGPGSVRSPGSGPGGTISPAKGPLGSSGGLHSRRPTSARSNGAQEPPPFSTVGEDGRDARSHTRARSGTMLSTRPTVDEERPKSRWKRGWHSFTSTVNPWFTNAYWKEKRESHARSLRLWRRVMDTGAPNPDSGNAPGPPSSETFAMSHLFQIRVHMSSPCLPSPAFPKWPFLWMWQVLWWNERFFIERCGVDGAVYLRFIRGCFYFCLLHTFTTLPVLLPIHLIYSPENIDKSSMSRASLSELTATNKGRSVLPVHVTILYYITISWSLTLVWIGRGAISIRRKNVAQLVGEEAEVTIHNRPINTRADGHPQRVGGTLQRVKVPAFRLERASEDQDAKDEEGQAKHMDSPKRRNSVTKVAADQVPGGDRRNRVDLPIELQVGQDMFQRGWRFRTVMVSNIPVDMRKPGVLERYFRHYLSKPSASKHFFPAAPFQFMKRSESDTVAILGRNPSKRKSFPPNKSQTTDNEEKKQNAEANNNLENDRTEVSEKKEEREFPDSGSQPRNKFVTKVVWVRKVSDLHEKMAKRNEILVNLERAHIMLARNVMAAVKARVEQRKAGVVGGALEAVGAGVDAVGAAVGSGAEAVKHEVAGLVRRVTKRPMKQRKRAGDDGKDTQAQTEMQGGEQSSPLPPNGATEEQGGEEDDGKESRKPPRLSLPLPDPEVEQQLTQEEEESMLQEEDRIENERRLDQLVDALKHLLPIDNLDLESSKKAASDQIMLGKLPADSGKSQSIWEVLASLPPELLDPYQPLTQLRYLFAGQSAPTIDYCVTKLNFYTTLIDDLRSRPESHAPAGVAFVTFDDVNVARRARRELGNHPRRRLFDCKIRAAPDVRDLDWGRLVKASLRSDALRRGVVEAGMWAFTILWVIPVSFLVSLISISNISDHWPALDHYFQHHPKQKALISTILPICLVSILSMLAPLLIRLLCIKGQTFVLRSKLFYSVLCRYWKWLFFNICLAFCIGTAALQSFLNVWNSKINPFDIIAQSFPQAATFFVGWFILQTSLHSAIELINILGILDWALSVRKADTPRRRTEKAIPRAFSYFYWVPNHLLVISITTIFSILNPLVLPFALVYFGFALIVFKNGFGRVYYRRWFEQNARMVYIRTMRYSLDALCFGQFTMIALMFFLRLKKLGGACIPPIVLTVGYKLVLTRWFKARMKAIDEEEADIFCGVPRHTTPTQSQDLPISDDKGRSSRFHTWKGPKKGIFQKHRPNHRTLGSVTGHLGGADLTGELDSQTGLPAPPSPTAPSTTLPPRREDSPILRKRSEDTMGGSEGPYSLDAVAATAVAEPLRESPREKFPEILSLARPCPPRRWDDTPDYSSEYYDPAFTAELPKRLWLPRDPLKDVNLDDTIEWYGHALVSSEGGSGNIGYWEPVLSHDHSLPLVETPNDVTESQPQDTPYATPLTEIPRPSAPIPPAGFHSSEPPTSVSDPSAQASCSAPDSNSQTLTASPKLISSPNLAPSPTSPPAISSPVGEGSLLSGLEGVRTPHRRLTGMERIRVAQEVAAKFDADSDTATTRRRRSSSVQSPRSQEVSWSETGMSPLERIGSYQSAQSHPSSYFSENRNGRHRGSSRQNSTHGSMTSRAQERSNSVGSVSQRDALIEEILQEEEQLTQERLKDEKAESTKATKKWRNIFFETPSL